MNDINSLLADFPTPELPSAVQARIESALRQSLRPVSPLPSLATRTGQFLGLFVAIGVLKLATFGTAAFAQMNIGELVGQYIVTIGVALLLSLSLAHAMTPDRLRRLSQAAAVTVGIALLVFGIILFAPSGGTRLFFADGWPCLRAGLLMALPAGLLVWGFVRRGAPLASPALGLTLGAAAGLLAAIVPNVSLKTCSHEDIVGHLLVFHGGAVLLSSVAGATIATAMRRIRTLAA